MGKAGKILSLASDSSRLCLVIGLPFSPPPGFICPGQIYTAHFTFYFSVSSDSSSCLSLQLLFNTSYVVFSLRAFAECGQHLSWDIWGDFVWSTATALYLHSLPLWLQVQIPAHRISQMMTEQTLGQEVHSKFHGSAAGFGFRFGGWGLVWGFFVLCFLKHLFIRYQ